LSCSRSERPPPHTIAPSRPLPSGRASTQRVAGRGYQRRRGRCGAGVLPAWALPASPDAASMAAAPDVASADGAAPAASAAAVALISSRRVICIDAVLPCGSGGDAVPDLPAQRQCTRASTARTTLRNGVSGVAHDGVGLRLQGARIATRPIDPAHADLALPDHARIAALATSDPELPLGLVPGQGDARELAALVTVVAAVVLVQRKAAVGTGVDLDGQRGVGLLVHVLLDHGARHDGAGTHEQRTALQRRIGRDRLPAGM